MKSTHNSEYPINVARIHASWFKMKKLQTFSVRIRLLRVASRISLPKLASKAGIGKSLLFKIETNPKANPTISTLKKISRALGVDVSTLVS